tara:strand:- start:207 stop:422 length:216 start_codon:yes stop_codon:yes gene_type:complete
MSEIGNNLLKSLKLKYEANIAAAKATMSIYLESPVGIGEHPQHLEEMDKLIKEIATNKDKLDAINNHYMID